MRASDLIPILSNDLGIPPETGRLIDRSLANAGLRYKHKGPNPPDMTREECLTFMIAAMASETATKAAEAVAPWLKATAMVPDYKGSLDRWSQHDDDDPELEYFKMPHDLGNWLPFIRELNGSNQAPLMRFLLLMLRDWEHVDSYADSVVFDLSRRGFGATITINHWDIDQGKIETPFFFHTDGEPNTANWEVADLDVRAFFHKEAFEVIIRYTADPLDEAAS